MQLNMRKAAPLSGERFHNLVSSGILGPLEWIDEQGDRHYAYEVGENKQATDYLSNLRAAVKRVAKSKAPAWTQVGTGRWDRYAISREARALWHAIRGVDIAHKARGREGEMYPYLQVGMRLAQKWEPRLRFFTNTNSELLLSEDYPRRMLAHLVYVIRRVCTAPRFLQRVERLERLQRVNFRECCRYFLSILRAHARLLVLRVDLYVEGLAKRAAAEGKIEQAVEKFVRNLREDRIIPDVLGYIIKREHAYDRGVHLHLMVIVDGDKHYQSYNLAERLKMYWIHDCVGSPEFASGFNCYLRKDEYRFNAIGHVHYADEAMLRGVRDAIGYLTKTDGHFLLPRGFGKNLRKGQPPKQQEGARRRGAPRKFADTSLAESILLGKPAQGR